MDDLGLISQQFRLSSFFRFPSECEIERVAQIALHSRGGGFGKSRDGRTDGRTGSDLPPRHILNAPLHERDGLSWHGSFLGAKAKPLKRTTLISGANCEVGLSHRRFHFLHASLIRCRAGSVPKIYKIFVTLEYFWKWPGDRTFGYL